MNTDDPSPKSDRPGCGCLLAGMLVIGMACLGYTFVPYARYGAQEPLAPWQMWGIGILLIAISIGGAIRQIRNAGRSMINTTTLEKTKDAEQESGHVRK